MEQSFSAPRVSDSEASFEVKTLVNKINAIYPEVQQGIDELRSQVMANVSARIDNHFEGMKRNILGGLSDIKSQAEQIQLKIK